MKHDIPLRSALLCLVPVLILGSGAARAGQPRSAAVAVTRTAPNGNSATRQTSVATNGQGGYSANSTLTGPKGNTTSRTQSGAYNAATKTYTRTGGTTGQSGKQTSFSTQSQATGNGYTRSATRTGANGKAAASSRTVTTNPPSN